MGFATLENILYVQKYGIQTGFLRMFLSVPAHATFGVLMGYHVGKAKFDPGQQHPSSIDRIALGRFFSWHCMISFYFCRAILYIKDYISDLLLFIGAVASFIIAIRLSLKHIKQHRLLSQQTYNPTRDHGDPKSLSCRCSPDTCIWRTKSGPKPMAAFYQRTS